MGAVVIHDVPENSVVVEILQQKLEKMQQEKYSRVRCE